MLRSTTLTASLFAALVTICFAGCQPPGPVTGGLLHIDNTTDETLTLYLEGEEAETVAPGEIKHVGVKLGQRHICLKSPNTEVFNQNYELKALNPQKKPWLMMKTNPDHRYCRVEIVYGDDSLSNGIAGGMTAMILNSTARKAVGDDPAAQQKWKQEQGRKQKYKTLLGKFRVFGEEPISHFTHTNFLCESMPEVVAGSRHSRSTRRSVVIRIPVELHDAINDLSKIEMPTEADLDQAWSLYDEAMSLVESRPF